MKPSSVVRLEVALQWQSPHARHCDRYYFENVGLEADCVPSQLAQQLTRLKAGESHRLELVPDDWLASYQHDLIKTVRRELFRRPGKHPAPPVVPHTGRFYPRNLISAGGEVERPDRRPMRCRQVDEQQLVVDLNHPLAGRDVEVRVKRLEPAASGKRQDADVVCDVLDIASDNGPGMQASLPDVDTDFFTEQAFTRIDEQPDSDFYAASRLVQHLDATCRDHIMAIYARFLQPGMKVLDLMSSWVSHLPEPIADLDVHGLGMNRDELQNNPRLSSCSIQDLNQQPELPFAGETFDAVICTASIEYLVQPLAVMQQLVRVLKPGAPLIITFTDRWFPTKAIQLWSELHPFERVALVLDYFRFSRDFTRLASETLRGYPRPADDPYSDKLDYSDPVFAVWGYRQ